MIASLMPLTRNWAAIDVTLRIIQLSFNCLEFLSISSVH